MIPESDDCKTLFTQPSIAISVMPALSMLKAITLDNQAVFEAGEIDNIGADRNLTAPFHRLQPPVPQQAPQDSLRVCFVGAQFASTRLCAQRNRMVMCCHNRLSRLWTHAPSPLAGEGGAKRRMRGPARKRCLAQPLTPDPSPARGEGSLRAPFDPFDAPSSEHPMHEPFRLRRLAAP